jgi:hypothetical protein
MTGKRGGTCPAVGAKQFWWLLLAALPMCLLFLSLWFSPLLLIGLPCPVMIDFLPVYHDATRTVTLCWPPGRPDMASVQDLYGTVLAALQAHNTHRVLIDCRDALLVPPEVAAWVVRHWLPNVQQALAPARPRLAYLMMPSDQLLLNEHEPSRALALEALSASSEQPAVVVFADEDGARRWLLQS